MPKRKPVEYRWPRENPRVVHRKARGPSDQVWKGGGGGRRKGRGIDTRNDAQSKGKVKTSQYQTHGKKQLCTNSRYNPSICLERMRNTTRKVQSGELRL
jgi:hypothetical protein